MEADRPSLLDAPLSRGITGEERKSDRIDLKALAVRR
jgi:hypothetical protein